MKKILMPIVLLAAVCFCTNVNADIVYVTEGFDYADGSLTSNAAWDTHSGTAGQIMVAGGEITLADTSTEDANTSLGTTITTGSVFAGFDFSVSAAAVAAGGDYEYFASFGNGTTDFTSRMDITGAMDTGDFRVGISGSSGTAQATWGTDLAFDTIYRAIIGYNRDTGISQLYIDAAVDTDTSIASAADTNDVTGFYFRQSGSSVNETITIDNLQVASSFDDVVTFIPEPTSCIVLGLAGLAMIRRRR